MFPSLLASCGYVVCLRNLVCCFKLCQLLIFRKEWWESSRGKSILMPDAFSDLSVGITFWTYNSCPLLNTDFKKAIIRRPSCYVYFCNGRLITRLKSIQKLLLVQNKALTSSGNVRLSLELFCSAQNSEGPPGSMARSAPGSLLWPSSQVDLFRCALSPFGLVREWPQPLVSCARLGVPLVSGLGLLPDQSKLAISSGLLGLEPVELKQYGITLSSSSCCVFYQLRFPNFQSSQNIARHMWLRSDQLSAGAVSTGKPG